MKKGFTLIELLAVIVILAIIALIATPIVLNIINSSRKSANERSIELYKHAVETAVMCYQATHPEADLKGEFTISSDGKKLMQGTNEVAIEYTGNTVKCTTIKMNDKGKLEYTGCSVSGSSNEKEVLFKEASLNGTDPVLSEEMLPVKYDGTNWKVVSPTSEWYNYENQEWANAVVLNSGTKNVGDTVNVDSEVKAMLVWIPRYEYKIEGQYGKGATTVPGSMGTVINYPGEVEVKFTTSTTANSGYTMHPAFTFGEDELSGFWVGKFDTTGTEAAPTIIPNTTAVTAQNVSQQFATAQLFNNYISDVDSHMMKNSEWGAVAYLSQSKYGKYGNSDYTGTNKEIYISPYNMFYVTGESTGSPSNSASPCQYDSIIDRGSGTGSCGGGASTTGNITGVYDMSGGSRKTLMGYYTPAGETFGAWGATSTSNDAGFASEPDAKYYDAYITTSVETACNGGICYGHALSETTGWYGTFIYEVSESEPWIRRGGYNGGGNYLTMFDSSCINGNNVYSFRVSIAPTAS